MTNLIKKIPNYKFIKISSFFLFLSFLFLNSYSESIGKENKYFFYKISTDTSVVYLLGSIHYGKAEWYPMPEKIETAFTKSDYLVTEIDINNIDPSILVNYMASKDGKTLQSKLKPKNYSKILTTLESMGMTEEMIQKLRPWFVAITYQTLKSTEEMELDQQDGVDMYFTKKANETKKEIKEIETAESQIKLLLEFDNFADEVIEAADKDSEDGSKQMKELVKAWEKGDDKKIDEFMNQQDKDFPQMSSLMEKLLDNRNVNMAKSINQYLKEKNTYFVVIGAGHLVGNQSIINNLKRNSKYKIERL